MNNKRLISLGICLILTTVGGLSSLVLADIASETDRKAEQHFEKANELRKVADHDGAIAEYEKAITLSPKSKIARNAQYWIGQSHFQAGRLDEALSAFKKLLDEHPTSTIALSTKQMMDRVQHAKEERTLVEAVKKGDVEQLKLLISNGADVNGRVKAEVSFYSGNATYVEEGWTLLNLAARYSQTDIAALLISKGADVNGRDEHGNRKVPLHYVGHVGPAALAELLIAKGANIEERERYGYTPLQCAAGYLGPDGNGQLDVVRLLISKGADIEAADDNGWTPLIWAASRNHPEIARLLLKRGALIDGKPYGDKTALREAVKSGHKDMAELLLAHGAAPGRRYLGQNLIMVAMYSHHKVGNQKEMVKLLVDKGVRHSPVHIAAFMGDLDEVKSYLATGGDINAQDPSHQLTLLMCAFYGGQTEEMEFLISKGADINLQDGEGNTVLHRCGSRGRLGLEHARMLLDKGADVTIRNDIGATPLSWGIPFYDVEHLKMLIAKGADVNTRHGPWLRAGIKNQGDEGWTPLHVVCMDAGWAGTEAKAEVLIAHGADVNAKTKKGKTPMSLAKERGDEQFIELLRKHGAKE